MKLFDKLNGKENFEEFFEKYKFYSFELLDESPQGVSREGVGVDELYFAFRDRLFKEIKLKKETNIV